MTDEELCFQPATTLAPLIREKRLSPVELMRAVVARIEQLEPKINAMAAFDPALAMARARAAEDAVMKGAALGPLHGLPVTIKDIHWTEDFTTEGGSHTQKGFRAPADTPSVARLRTAGALVIGKTTTSELAWSGVSRAPLTGITSNPWKQGYNAGASSAGAGAAAAAGYGPLHQGSDGAGSIRMPSHFCGVFGLKGTHGRVPTWPVSASDYTAHIGPMTRTVADGALMMHVMSGPHPLDHTSLEAPPADYLGRLDEGVRGRRVAFSPDLGHARVDPEVAAIVHEAACRFADAAGLHMVEATPDWGPEGAPLIRGFYRAHMQARAALLPEFESRMDPGLVACIRDGAGTTMADYQDLRTRKLAFTARIHEWFEDWDFLITPAASVPAFPAERLIPAHWPQHDWDWISWAEFSHPFNMSWNPAASIPAGFTSDGLPVGLQIVGRRFDDLGVLQASRAFEQALPWAQHKPAMEW
jgi:aspartyl-tRNA(Asn)/glutamyl-tRNA(Gln) amidotransferase subunit A